jgi:hypothetical protein
MSSLSILTALPKTGVTDGGNVITIYGAEFGTNMATLSVMIGNPLKQVHGADVSTELFCSQVQRPARLCTASHQSSSSVSLQQVWAQGTESCLLLVVASCADNRT